MAGTNKAAVPRQKRRVVGKCRGKLGDQRDRRHDVLVKRGKLGRCIYTGAGGGGADHV